MLGCKPLIAIAGIDEQAELMLSVTQDILDIVNLEQSQFNFERLVVDLRWTLTSVLASAEQACLQKNIEFELDYDSRLPKFVFADPTRLQQVVMSLVSNAVKATTTGSVRVAFRRIPNVSPLPVGTQSPQLVLHKATPSSGAAEAVLGDATEPSVAPAESELPELFYQAPAVQSRERKPAKHVSSLFDWSPKPENVQETVIPFGLQQSLINQRIQQLQGENRSIDIDTEPFVIEVLVYDTGVGMDVALLKVRAYL